MERRKSKVSDYFILEKKKYSKDGSQESLNTHIMKDSSVITIVILLAIISLYLGGATGISPVLFTLGFFGILWFLTKIFHWDKE